MTHVRPASASDVERIAAIYAPFVTDTHISFEESSPSAHEMGERVARSVSWLVGEEDGHVVGYTYAWPFHERAAYRWSVEVSVYLAPDARGRGVGRLLLSALVDDLKGRGFVNAFAGVALPNDASVRLFEGFGFHRIALWENVGFKMGRWHDVGWWQLQLKEPPDEPPEPTR